MAAEYDNLLKYLAENHAEALACWLLGRPVKNRVRMLGYFVRTYRRERKLVRQAVIVLAETRVPIPDEFHVGETRHRYRVVKMWEQDPEPLLAEPGLAPLAVLARAAQPENLVRRVADQVQRIPEPGLRSDSTAAAFLLAGLRFNRSFLRSLFKEEIMIHSSTYQDLVERSEQRGEQRGVMQGTLSVLKELLKHRFGQLTETLEEALTKLDVPTLIHLSVAQSDLASLDELSAWIEQHKQDSHNGAVQNGAA